MQDIILMLKLIACRHFDERTGQKERIGTDTDADNMTDVLTNLGFKVRRFDNLDRITMTLKSQEGKYSVLCLFHF